MFAVDVYVVLLKWRKCIYTQKIRMKIDENRYSCEPVDYDCRSVILKISIIKNYTFKIFKKTRRSKMEKKIVNISVETLEKVFLLWRNWSICVHEGRKRFMDMQKIEDASRFKPVSSVGEIFCRFRSFLRTGLTS